MRVVIAITQKHRVCLIHIVSWWVPAIFCRFRISRSVLRTRYRLSCNMTPKNAVSGTCTENERNLAAVAPFFLLNSFLKFVSPLVYSYMRQLCHLSMMKVNNFSKRSEFGCCAPPPEPSSRTIWAQRAYANLTRSAAETILRISEPRSPWYVAKRAAFSIEALYPTSTANPNR